MRHRRWNSCNNISLPTSQKETLKGQCHEIFFLFSWISFPPALEYSINTVSNVFENSRRYSQVKVHHRYQRHRWQIFPAFSLALLIPVANLPPVSLTPVANNNTISGCRHLKLNLKAKIYIYVNSTTQRCQNKIIKIFQLADFCYLPTVSTTPVAKLELHISPRIFEKIRNSHIVIIRGLGETDSWKNQKQKISWHCPFK